MSFERRFLDDENRFIDYNLDGDYGLPVNKILHGNCLDLMQDLPDGSIDMILCDLPYGTTQCKWDAIIPFEPLWREYKRIIKERGAIVLTASQPFTSALIMSNIDMFKYEWIWNKKQGGNPLNAKIQPLKIHESILVFGVKPSYYPIMRKGKMRKKGGLNKQPEHLGKVDLDYSVINDNYYPVSILEKSNANKRNKVHPTQKPVELFEYLIKTYTKEGELVLDNCIGSGTTAIACINTSRNFIGIELDAEYYKIAVDRVNKTSRNLKSMIVGAEK